MAVFRVILCGRWSEDEGWVELEGPPGPAESPSSDDKNSEDDEAMED